MAIVFCTFFPIGGSMAIAAPGSEPFSAVQTQTCPPSTVLNDCTVSFGSVPAKHYWLVRYVSCHVGISNLDATVNRWYLYSPQPNTGMVELRPTRLGTNGNYIFYNANEQAYLRLPPRAPVEVDAVTNMANVQIGLDCSIGGDSVSKG